MTRYGAADDHSRFSSLAKDTHSSRARCVRNWRTIFISFSDFSGTAWRRPAVPWQAGIVRGRPHFRTMLSSRRPRPRVAASNETQQPGRSCFHTRFANGRRRLGWISIAPQQLRLLIRNIVVASPQEMRAVTIAGPFLRKQSDVDFGNRCWDWLGRPSRAKRRAAGKSWPAPRRRWLICVARGLISIRCAAPDASSNMKSKPHMPERPSSRTIARAAAFIWAPSTTRTTLEEPKVDLRRTVSTAVAASMSPRQQATAQFAGRPGT